MRVVFDRGTLLFCDVGRGAPVGALPGVAWDARVHAYRAPARAYPLLRPRLAALGIGDEVRPRLLGPGPWTAPELRPYQAAAVAEWWRAGQRGLVALPTGAGKTRVAIAAMARTRARALCLVPTRVLMEQWAKSLERFYAASIGILGDGTRRVRAITVGTFESVFRLAPRLGDRFDLLVVDEAHHFGRGLRDEALEMTVAGARIGLTATPPEDPAHLERLSRLIGPIVCSMTVDELAGTYLAPYRTVRLGVDLSDDERRAYDDDMARFRVVRNAIAGAHPALEWPQFVAIASKTDAGRRALASLARAKEVEAFNAGKRRAIDAIFNRHANAKILLFTGDNHAAYAIAREHLVPPITCDIDRSERAEILEAFARGRLRRLVSSRVLNEGIDVPDAEIAVIVGGRHGRREHIQRLGRILRPSANKEAILYELVTRGTNEARRRGRRAA